MKYHNKRFLSRALALVLALAVLAALPAWADEIAVESGDASETIDVLSSDSDADEAPVAEADALLLADALEAPPEAADAETPAESPDATDADTDAAAQANTSVPEPDYEPQSYSFDVGKKSTFTVKVGDTLEICFPKANGKSWASSKTSVAAVSPASDSYSALFTAVATGTTKLTLTLSNGKKYKVTLKVKDPYALASMSLTKSSVTLLAGMDLDLSDYIAMKPVYAKAKFTYTSSKPSVAKVSAGGIVTGMKAGSATITVKSSGLKKKLKVKVRQNITGKLHSAATKSAAKAQGKRWTLWPRTLELQGNGALICRFYLLNGSAGKIKSLRNLDLAVILDTDNGENLIARHTFSKVTVSCAKNKYATVKLTFPAREVYYAGVKLASLDASKLRFRLYSAPTAVNGSHTYAYNPTAIESVGGASGDSVAENPVTYRALIVSEDDFYFSRTAGQSRYWEHIARNRNDANLMSAMLGRVKTPDGGKYSVTVRHNTSHAGLVKLIQSAFANADDNDVSLFFIATHGDSDDATPANKSGALVMASLDEAYPEYLYLTELRDLLLKVPGKVVVILESCGSGAAVTRNNAVRDAYASARAFDAQAAALFGNADPGVVEGTRSAGGLATNTGELRKVNKFYVLCASEYKEESWGIESASSSYNFFTRWLAQGVGKSGSMPADRQYAGNGNGVVDLHELYRYISGVGDHTAIKASDGTYYQHVQVYPSDVRYALFK